MHSNKFFWIVLGISLFLVVISWRGAEDAKRDMREEYGPKIEYSDYWENEGVPSLKKSIEYARRQSETAYEDEFDTLLEDLIIEVESVIYDAPLPF